MEDNDMKDAIVGVCIGVAILVLASVVVVLVRALS